MYTLGVNLSHHSSIALLKDNEVLLYIQEERLNRRKDFHGVPLKSLDLINRYTKVIDVLVFKAASNQAAATVIRHLSKQNISVKHIERGRSKHHLAHAASAFHMSGMDHACVIVIDGAGSSVHLGKLHGELIRANETTSIYDAKFSNSYQCVYKKCVAGYYNKVDFDIDPQMVNIVKEAYGTDNCELTKQHDIGWKYYSTTKRIGFGNTGEGKTMGLSGYGSSSDSTQQAKEAYNIQQELNKLFIDIAKFGLDKVKTNNLVLGGGCALNIIGNSLIKRHFPNINIFADPVASDASIALGAAVETFYRFTSSKDKLFFSSYQGPKHKIETPYIYECARKYSI